MSPEKFQTHVLDAAKAAGFEGTASVGRVATSEVADRNVQVGVVHGFEEGERTAVRLFLANTDPTDDTVVTGLDVTDMSDYSRRVHTLTRSLGPRVVSGAFNGEMVTAIGMDVAPLLTDGGDAADLRFDVAVPYGINNGTSANMGSMQVHGSPDGGIPLEFTTHEIEG